LPPQSHIVIGNSLLGPQQIGQYNNFLKNISIMGGALAMFVTGAGRFSLDSVLAK